MNDLVRIRLGELVATHGTSLCEDARRCRGLLLDYCSNDRREVNALMLALNEGIPVVLQSSPGTLPPRVIVAQLTKRLYDSIGMAEEVAQWVVESWAMALGVLPQDKRSEPSAADVPIPPMQIIPDSDEWEGWDELFPESKPLEKVVEVMPQPPKPVTASEEMDPEWAQFFPDPVPAPVAQTPTVDSPRDDDDDGDFVRRELEKLFATSDDVAASEPIVGEPAKQSQEDPDDLLGELGKMFGS